MLNNSADKMRSTDRILSLEVIDGKKPITSTGLVDSRLFTGENKLHAICDTQTMFWSLKYDMGGLPPALKDTRFTSFSGVLKHAGDYFMKRNIKIKEVVG